MDKSKVVETVDAALAADQLIKKLERELSVLKDELKSAGVLLIQQGENNVQFHGTTGHATVAAVKGAAKVRKGADLIELMIRLGDEKFDELFVKQVSYVPVSDFEDRFCALQESERQAVGEAVDVFTTTTKINFYPKK